MACSSHSPRVRGTLLLQCDLTLPPEVIRYFFHPENCPLLAGSCTRYELQLSPGRKERRSASQIRGVAHATSTESLRYPMDTSFLSINRADGYWFETKPSTRRPTNSASTNSSSSRGGSARAELNCELMGEECNVAARKKGRAAQSFGGYEECELYTMPRNEDSSIVYEIEYHESENYRRYFKGHPHLNYFTHSRAESKQGPCLLSIMPYESTYQINKLSSNVPLHPHSCAPLYRIILRSQEHFLHGIIQAKDFHASDVRACVQALARELALQEQFRVTTYPNAESEILNMDESFVKDKVKIGVINIKPGQKTELEFLSNMDESGPFRDFLAILGDRVDLKGFPEFDGGLDIRNDTTGKYSVYTRWEGYEVMCHVATLLPYSPTDEQMVQKKRHIGNDLVCIIFLEGDAVFSPRAVKSRYIHVFIVVKVLYEKESALPARYKITTVCRDGVPLFSPYLLEKNVFEHGPELKDFIICKCINSEKAAVKSPKFQQLQKRTRTYLLQHLCRAMEDYECVRKITPRKGMRNQPQLNAEVYENVERLVSDYRKVFSIPELCDVVFIVSANQLPIFGIKAIIASRSRSLANLLNQSPQREKKSRKQSKIASLTRRPSNSISHKLRHKFNFDSPLIRPTSPSLRSFKKKFFKGKKSSSKGVGNQSARVLQEYSHLDQYLFEEFDEISFSQLMEYLMCGQCVINPLTIAGLVAASDLFELPELRQACFEHLPHCLIVDLICPILSSLETYIQFPSAKTLTVKVLAFLDLNAEDVLCSDFFPNISEFLLSSIMQRNLRVQEDIKLEAILAWAESHSLPLEQGNILISHLLQQLDLKKLSSNQLMQLANVKVIDTDSAMRAIAFQLDPNSVGSSEA